MIKASVEKQSLVVDDQSTTLIQHSFVYSVNSQESHPGVNHKREGLQGGHAFPSSQEWCHGMEPRHFTYVDVGYYLMEGEVPQI